MQFFAIPSKNLPLEYLRWSEKGVIKWGKKVNFRVLNGENLRGLLDLIDIIP